MRHFVTLLLLLAFPATGEAFQLQGSADFELESGEFGSEYVSLAGFQLSESATTSLSLELFSEFGPFDRAVGGTDGDNVAGQIWVTVDIPLGASRFESYVDAEDPALFGQLELWDLNLNTVFAGTIVGGWVDGEALWEDGELYYLDLRFHLDFAEREDGAQTSMSGVFFGGSSSERLPVERRTVRTSSGSGCGGETVYVYDDPYYDDPYYVEDDDNGCGGDEPSSSDSDSGGCAGDDFGGGSDSSGDEDMSCAGDSPDTGDSSDSSGAEDMSCAGDSPDTGDSSDDDDDDSGPECEGDDLSQAGFIGKPRRSRPFVASAMRYIHLWVPMGFVLFGKLRHRRESRTQRSKT